MTEQKIRRIIAVLIILTIVSIAGLGYIGYSLKKTTEQLTNTVEKLQAETEAKIEMTRNMVNAAQEEYLKKTEAVTKALERLDKESKSRLSDLEEDLKNVNIKSGDFSAILDKVFPGVVNIATDKGRGTGAIITNDGYIVTNYHVVKDARVVQVVDYNKKIYAAQPIGAHVGYDIAVLKINGTFKDLNFADSSKLKVGEHVIAVGNPAGLSLTVTEGIISQLDRIIGPKDPPMIQIDVPINPGNSGGPLININGNIVGINRLKIAGYESLGFAIPSNVVKPVVEEIIQRDI